MISGEAGEKVSVIIPARNEAGKIARCVESVLSQDFNGEFEIIVVDDNSEVLRSMTRLLEGWGCRVVAATAVEEVLTTIIDQDITPQLLLADYHLADGANGIEAITAINAEITEQAPAIMVSSDNSPGLREQLKERDIPLLTKPVEPARLRALMQHMLASA